MSITSIRQLENGEYIPYFDLRKMGVEGKNKEI